MGLKFPVSREMNFGREMQSLMRNRIANLSFESHQCPEISEKKEVERLVQVLNVCPHFHLQRPRQSACPKKLTKRLISLCRDKMEM